MPMAYSEDMRARVIARVEVLSGDWPLRRQAARREHLPAGGARGLFAGADRGAARPDAGRGGFCDAQAQDFWQPHGSLAFLSAPQDHFQKKACARRSRSARTWPGHAGAGCESRACLTQLGWCSSMRRPRIPRWCGCMAGASAASDWWAVFRRNTGRPSPSWPLCVGMA